MTANQDQAAQSTAPAASEPSNSKSVPHEIRRLRVDGYINAVAWSFDGSRLAALSQFGSTITVWDAKTWNVVKEFRRDGGAYSGNSLAFLPDGSLLTAALGEFSNEGPDGNLLKAAQIGDHSGDPDYIVPSVSNLKYHSLKIFSLIDWNLATGQPIRYIPPLEFPPSDLSPKITNTFAISRDRALIAAIKDGRSVWLYDASSGVRVQDLPTTPLPEHPDVANSVAFSPDGQELVVGTAWGWVHFFGVRDGVLRRSFRAYTTGEYRVAALAFSPDGKSIATGKAKGFDAREPNEFSTHIWRVSDGASIAMLPGATWILHGKTEAVSVRAMDWFKDLLAVGDDRSLRNLAKSTAPQLSPSLSRGSPTAFTASPSRRKEFWRRRATIRSCFINNLRDRERKCQAPRTFSISAMPSTPKPTLVHRPRLPDGSF